MVVKITKSPELHQALAEDQAVYLVDTDGNTTHIVFPVEEARLMFDDYLRREIHRGVDQSDRGESAPWDVEATLTEARRRHDSRPKRGD